MKSSISALLGCVLLIAQGAAGVYLTLLLGLSQSYDYYGVAIPFETIIICN